MTAVTHDWAAPGTYSAGNLITGNGTSGDLKDLQTTNTALGAEVNNEGGAILSGIEFKCKLQSNASGLPYVEIWFLKALGGTTYEDGSAGGPGTIPARTPDLVIPVRITTTDQQVISVGPVSIPNSKFKTLLRNSTGQRFTNVDNENQLSYRTWGEESN